MNDPPQDEEFSQDPVDLLIAISVVARHLARKLEELRRLEKHKKAGEKDHEQDEQPGGVAG